MVRSYIKKKKKIVSYVSVFFTVAVFLMLLYGLQRGDNLNVDNLNVECINSEFIAKENAASFKDL